jgi:hypothetical protein
MTKGLCTGLAVICLLLFASSACGGQEPFVGSWKPVDGSADTLLVIARTDNGYRVATVNGGGSAGWLDLARSGDTLSGSWRPHGSSGPTIHMKVVRDGDRLLLTDNQFRNFPFERASDETSIPSPSSGT